MSLLDRIFSRRAGAESRMNVDQWITDYMVPSTFNFGGTQYLYGGTGYSRMMIGDFVTEISSTLPAYSAAVRACPPAFAAEMVRALVISQARFTFRNRPSSGQPRRTFGNRNLSILERPGNGLTTAKLLGKMEWHAGLAGNAYVYRQAGEMPGDPPRLRLLRPDWVGILYGSQREPEDPQWALDAELVGYVYWNGGFGGGYDAWTLRPSEVAHWAPLPDPEAAGLGMSWITPALREMQGDRAATEHKLRFFANGATPSLVVTGIAGQGGQPLTRDQFDDVVNMMERRHAGTGNAYKTLYLTAGADARVIGTDLKQIDFKATQGAGETRISFLSRVPAPLLGISEGLAGSSLNAGNFGMARRIFADSWIYPVLQDLAGTFAPIVDVPADAELWYDTSDMPILREDSKDQADILQTQMTAIASGVNAGYKPESVVSAIQNNDLGQLQHTGLYSVQLQPPQPGQTPGDATAPADGAEAPDAGGFGEALRTILSKLDELHTRYQPDPGGEPPAGPRRPAPPAAATPAPPKSAARPAAPKQLHLRKHIDPIAAARSEVAKMKAVAAAPAAATRAREILAADVELGDVVAAARQALGLPVAQDADVEDDGDPGLDLDTYALLVAMAEYAASRSADALRLDPFDQKHPRGNGGRFRTVVDRLKAALAKHEASGGEGDPFAGFDRDQLHRAAKAQGLALAHGAGRDEIAKALVDHLKKPAPTAAGAKAVLDRAPATHPAAIGKSDAGKSEWVERAAHAARGEAALESAPAKLQRPPRGHYGDYSGEGLTAPAGHGDVRALSEMEGVEYSRTNGELWARHEPGYAPPSFDQYEPVHAAGLQRIADETDRRIEEVDKTMAVSPLPQDTLVYRGMTSGSELFGTNVWFGLTPRTREEDPNFELEDAEWARFENGYRPDLTGLEWTQRGYLHTTVKPDRLTSYAKNLGFKDKMPVAMTILLPKGTQAIRMSEIDHEAELMAQRGLKLRVVADHGEDENGVRHLDLEVVGVDPS